MSQNAGRRDPRLGGLVSFSILLHLVIFGVADRIGRLIPPVVPSVIHEVDLVSLPVADPAPGDSPPPDVGPPSPSDTPPSAPSATPVTRSRPAAPEGTVPSSAGRSGPAVDGEEVERKIEELRRKEQERHLEESLRRLRERGSPAPEGVRDGKGSDRGVDYTSHLHQLLTEAFRETITYQSPAPETTVRIIIDGKGRLIGTRIERRSGDRLFDDAVLRAIGKVARTLPPPPDGKVYEHGFVFRPEGIGQ